MGEEGEERPQDFDQIVEITGLDPEQVTTPNHGSLKVHHLVSVQIDSLKKGFDGFDKEGGTINQTTMMMILKSMGVDVNKVDMENYSSEVDEQETGKFSFSMFCQVAGKFMIEDDEEQMKEELKEAFRIYDKENQGFITNDILKVNINVSSSSTFLPGRRQDFKRDERSHNLRCLAYHQSGIF